MMRPLIVVLVILTADTASAAAQSSPVGDVQPNIFQESSTIALGTPSGKKLLFEARPALHLYVLNQFGDKQWQKRGERETSLRWLAKAAFATGFSFLPELRMSTDRSNPVRTPSYRIRATQQVLFMKRGDSDADKYRITGWKLTAFGHYSNGQSGCRLLGYAAVDREGGDSICVSVDPVVAARREPNRSSRSVCDSIRAGLIAWLRTFLERFARLHSDRQDDIPRSRMASTSSTSPTVATHFEKSSPPVAATYAALLEASRQLGPVREDPKKPSNRLMSDCSTPVVI
jgi:hypothetical protein